MSKKLQLIIWIVILTALIIFIGTYCYNTYRMTVNGNSYPEVTFELENLGTVKVELYPEYAPNTVANFIKLAQNGFYDGKVIYGKDDYCLYAGRTKDGTPEEPTAGYITDEFDVGSADDYKYSIEGEFIANGFKDNTLSLKKGVLTLIRNDYTTYVQSLTKESYNSGNSQIGFMMDDEAYNLSGMYAGFGVVTEGIEILENVFNNCNLAPQEPAEAQDGVEVEDEHDHEESEGAIKAFAEYPLITKVTVDTKGIEYGLPKVQEAFDYEAYMYNLFSQYSQLQ